MCTRPFVSFQTRKLSTVPNNRSPRSALSRAPGTFSRIQRTFVAEKYASITSPVFLRMVSLQPFSFRESQYSAVRLHCQTMALYTGLPVALSHTMVVSRWLVMPIAAIWDASTPSLALASLITASWLAQISVGSCSTQPGLG